MLTSRLRELLEKASKTPWRVHGDNKCSCKKIWSETDDTHVATGKPVACVHGEWGDDPRNLYGENKNVSENSELICLLRNHASALLYVVEAADKLAGKMGTKEHPVPSYLEPSFRVLELSLYALEALEEGR